jgi:soluble lytic murein transglycosylase-like protein
MKSVERQVQRSRSRVFLQSDAEPAAGCEKVAPSQIAAIADSAGNRHGVPTGLIRAVIQRESGGDPCAVSPKGALGLMQLMPEAARDLRLVQPFDPVGNVDAGTQLLKELLNRYSGNLSLALAAYNAGSGAVERAGGIPPFAETRDYVTAILSALGTN